MDRRKWLVLAVVLGAATAGRLWVAAHLPLVDDEAYYWAWSQRLAWGYPDHPPLVAGLIRLTTSILGDTALGVRIGAVMLTLLTGVLLFDLGRMMFGTAAGVLAATAFQVIPFFTVGGLLALPDAPLMFFWMLALWALWRARSNGRAVHWYLAGAAGGLAIMSKLTAGLLGVSILGFLWTTPTERQWLRRREPYLAAALAIAIALLMILWNAQHDWVTFLRVRDRWMGPRGPVLNVIAFVLAQLAYYGPVTFALLVAALSAAGSNRYRLDTPYRFVLWAALPIIGLTWIASVDALPKPHWHAPGLLAALLASGALWPSLRTRLAWRVTATAAAAINVAAVLVLVTLALRTDTPAAGQVWGWDQAARSLVPAIESTPEVPGRFVMAENYQMAGQLEFQLERLGDGHLVVTRGGSSAYGLWAPEEQLIGWNAIYLDDLEGSAGSTPGEDTSPAAMFKELEELSPIEIIFDGRVVRRISVYRGLGFLGTPSSSIRAP